jgi:hypothetical protein
MAGEISEGMLFDIGYADGITPFSQFRKNQCRMERVLTNTEPITIDESGSAVTWEIVTLVNFA